MIIKVKKNMNSQEIGEWKAGKAFIFFKGEYKYKNWKLNIYVDCFENIDIRVGGYNGICFGKFELDNGWNSGESYYPVMRFYNKLSLSERGWVCSDTLCSDVDFGNEEICELNLERIFKAVDDSWNKIKEFLS